MRLFNQVNEQLQKYYVTRSMDALREAMEIIAKEIEAPTLQEHTITIAANAEEVEKIIESEGFFRIDLVDGNSDGPIEPGKLVRVVHDGDDPTVGCMILNVAHINDEEVILVAPGGGG